MTNAEQDSPWTVESALSAICAGDSGEFWESWMERPAREARDYLNGLEAALAAEKAHAKALYEALKEAGCEWAIPCARMQAEFRPDHETCNQCAALAAYDAAHPQEVKQ